MNRVTGDLYCGPVRRRVALVAVSVLVCIAPGIAEAQEAPPALEFSFSDPGARSMGLGGAFVALADDATAAFSNPAGLVQLLRPEVSLELRRRNYSIPRTEGGRASGHPTGLGIDTTADIRSGLSKTSTSGVSFLSFVYPGGKWSLALYRHQLADFSVRTEINGLFGDAEEGGTRRYLDQFMTTDLEIVGTGLSGAYQISDRLSVGIGFSYFSGMVENHGEAYSVDVFPDTFWEENSFLPHRLIVTSSFDVDDTDVGFGAGLLWKFAEGWRLGGVYRQGPRFDYELYNVAGPLNEEPEGTIIGSVTDRSIAFPDVMGFGVAYRSLEGDVTVGFQCDWIEYSVIMETLDSEQIDTSDVALDDGIELRVGLEYAFLKTSPLIAARIGLWRDPAHRFEYVGDDPFSSALYRPGKDTLHLSVGAGVAFKNFQIDIGADFSDFADSFAVSAIYSF